MGAGGDTEVWAGSALCKIFSELRGHGWRSQTESGREANSGGSAKWGSGLVCGEVHWGIQVTEAWWGISCDDSGSVVRL